MLEGLFWPERRISKLNFVHIPSERERKRKAYVTLCLIQIQTNEKKNPNITHKMKLEILIKDFKFKT